MIRRYTQGFSRFLKLRFLKLFPRLNGVTRLIFFDWVLMAKNACDAVDAWQQWNLCIIVIAITSPKLFIFDVLMPKPIHYSKFPSVMFHCPNTRTLGFCVFPIVAFWICVISELGRGHFLTQIIPYWCLFDIITWTNRRVAKKCNFHFQMFTSEFQVERKKFIIHNWMKWIQMNSENKYLDAILIPYWIRSLILLYHSFQKKYLSFNIKTNKREHIDLKTDNCYRREKKNTPDRNLSHFMIPMIIAITRIAKYNFVMLRNYCMPYIFLIAIHSTNKYTNIL